MARTGVARHGAGRGRFGLLLLSICLGVVLPPAVAHGFHEGGAGYCEGCHGLHRSPQAGGAGQPRAAGLLRGPDASSTCLNCHAEPGSSHAVMSANGSARTPGGDFHWLTRTFSWSVGNALRQSPGNRHGHNVVATGHGLQPDSERSVAPGGTYPSSGLSCVSCHDPHGKSRGRGPVARSGSYGLTPASGTDVGAYRMLGGIGHQGFASPAPVARAPLADWTETDSNHPAYGSGMSEWCANCHADYVTAGGDRRKHPVGKDARLGTAVAAAYNAYVKTGDLTGTQATAYSALVPFERGTTDASALDPSSTAGPDGSANVSCLTCHRAHASAFPNMGRWDFTATFLVDSHPREGDSGATSTDVLNSYYGRTIETQFGRYQRSLCNKCHARD